VDAVGRLRIMASVRPWRRRGLHVTGSLSATVQQRCVVTLEPVTNDIDETFEATFEPVARTRRAATGKAIDFDALESADPPEPMTDGAADVGALAVEYLALAIDPYPRKPGVDVEQVLPGPEEPDERPGAFDILRKLK